jgi:large subunit ribosomal protein L29
MKYKELSTKSETQLRKELDELRHKALGLRVKTKLRQTKNIHELAGVRKDIARILTYLRAN